MNPLLDLKRRVFPRGVKRDLRRYTSRVFERTTAARLTAAFQQLRMERGAVICVHSMLSGLGYIVGGPETVLHALRHAVPDCTIMMPTFPFDGSVVDYLKNGPVYDAATTPSRSGLLTEVLRRFPGTLRSLHPTHPCAALGPQADFLIRGSEKCETPFGDDSTYGRFTGLDQAVLLLIHTNNTSIVHRIQEMAEMPNLFLPEKAKARGLDIEGNLVDYTVRLHTPTIPLYVIMPGDGAGELEYLWFPDYAALLPEYNRTRILAKLNSRRAKQILIDRHEFFVQRGWLRTVKLREAELVAIRVKPWIDRLCADVRHSIETYRDAYGLEHMQQAQQGRLTKY